MININTNPFQCQLECPYGTYGDRCKHNCSENCKNKCAATSSIGKCNDGCKPGYEGDDCSKGNVTKYSFHFILNM